MARRRHRYDTVLNVLIAVTAFLAVMFTVLLCLVIIRDRREMKNTEEFLSSRVETIEEQGEMPESLSTDGSNDGQLKTLTEGDATAEGTSGEDAAATLPDYSEEELQNKINEALPGIVCWGDSITYGYLSEGATYPSTLRDRIDQDYIEPLRRHYGYTNLKAPAVFNFGVSAETTTEITGRIGSMPYKLVGDVTIPAGAGAAVNVDIADAKGDNSIRPIKDVEPHNQMTGNYNFALNPLTIKTEAGDVSCDLERYYDSEADRSRYRLVRKDEGPEVTIPAGTRLISASAGRYKNCVCVVMMGANGGYAEDGGADLADQFKAAVSGYGKYLCIGMGKEKTYTASAELFPEYATNIKAAFGDRFVSIQELLTGSVNSHIPGDILNADGLHYNARGYTYIGDKVYEKLTALGYFDDLKALSGQ